MDEKTRKAIADRLVAKFDSGEALTPAELEDMTCYLTVVDEWEGEEKRWTRDMSTIVESPDGRYFRIDWERGLTEVQEPFVYEKQPIEVHRQLEERTVIITTWEEGRYGL